jgi:hypothetical protein
MTEHIPVLGIPQKILHGAYDLATGDKDLSQVADDTLNPMADAKYWGGVVKAVGAPMIKAIEEGKPGEAVGEVGIIAAAMLTGAGEAGAAAEGAEAASAAGELATGSEGAAAIGEGSAPVRVPVDPNVNPFGPTEAPPSPVGPTELPPDFLQNPTKIPSNPLPNIPEAPPGGFPEPPPTPASPALRGMDIRTVGTPTGELAGMSEAEIDAFVEGMEESGKSETFFELPGQNPETGAGLQDIVEPPPNPNPNQIAQNVNHYFSDVGSPRIAEMSDVPVGGRRGPGGSVIPEGVGTTGEPVPQTALENADGSRVLNEAGNPIGNRNVEVRSHSANPRFPDQGPTVQVNTPKDQFGWQGNRGVAVEGEVDRYLLPDGTWVEMADLQAQIRAARAAGDAAEVARLNRIAESAHWPTGG